MFAELAWAEERTFIDPVYTFRSGVNTWVDPCVNSFKYPTCNKAAGNKVAFEYCRYKGFSDWSQWKSVSVDGDSDNAKYTEKYVDGELWEGWVRMTGGWRMTVITCTR